MALATLAAGTLNVARAGRLESRAYAILRALHGVGLNVVALQECQNVDFNDTLIQRLGWDAASKSTCMRAAVLLKRRHLPHMIASYQADRVAMIVHRSGVCFTSAYFADASHPDAPEICRRILHDVRRLHRQAQANHGHHFRLLLACDANVELTPELEVDGRRVTGPGLRRSRERGLGRNGAIDLEDRRAKEVCMRDQIEEFLEEEELAAINTFEARVPTYWHFGESEPTKVLDYILAPRQWTVEDISYSWLQDGRVARLSDHA
ncbi:unnamed protein product, partial [Prorocentrum cordatum]